MSVTTDDEGAAQLDADQTKRVAAGLAAAQRGAGLDPRRREEVVAQGRAALEELLQRHDAMALWQAHKHARQLAQAGMSVADGHAIARAGLAHAIGRFDPSRGYRLSTYAVAWLRQVLVRSCRARCTVVPAPSWAALYGEVAAPVRRAARPALRTVSLHAPGGDGRPGWSLAEQLADPGPGVEEQALEALGPGSCEQVAELLGSLPGLDAATAAAAAELVRSGADGGGGSSWTAQLRHPAVVGAVLRLRQG